MHSHEYEYIGLIAEYWDLLRGDTSQWSSRPYFLEVIKKSGQPALDVACGTGRLLIDYLGQGIEIDGVDVSPDMLLICREKADQLGLKTKLYQQAMAELDLPRRYQTIIVASSSFLQITDSDDARQALERFWLHMMPGGTLSMSMRVLDPDPAEALDLLREAGFVDVHGHHDFTDQPLSEDDTRFTVAGTRPK